MQDFILSTEYPNAPGLWSDEQVNAWKQITDAVHGEGGYIYAQVRLLTPLPLPLPFTITLPSPALTCRTHHSPRCA